MKKVFLDPGHGGRDPGAVGPSGTKESNITLSVAFIVKMQLEAWGAEVKMARESDVSLGNTLNDDLLARVREANKWGADAFVSIHTNSSVSHSATGSEIYTTPGQTKGDELATFIGRNMMAAFPGIPFRQDLQDGDLDKEANFMVLRLTNMPAALVELAFISNITEEKMLNSREYQVKVAYAIASGIADYLGISMTTNKPKILVGDAVLEGIIIGDVTYAPVRLLAESLGKQVQWDGSTNTVTVK